MLRFLSLIGGMLIVVISAGMLFCVSIIGERLPEGWQIDYATLERDGMWYIQTMDLDRGLDYRMETGVRLRDVPLLSPDRRFLLNRDFGQLTLHNLQNGSETIIEGATPISWSPDSRRFSYVTLSNSGIGFDLFMMAIDDTGGVLESITLAEQVDMGSSRSVQWSPDGELSVYFNIDLGVAATETTLYLADADGQNSHQIAPEAVNIRDVAWSPDSTQLVFINEDFSSEAPLASLERINVDGSGRTQLAIHVGFQQSSLAWSPDGRFIAYAIRTRSNVNGLYIYDAETGAEIGHIFLNLNMTDIRWSPDSTRLIFRSGRDSDFYVVDRDGRNIRRLTDNDNLNVLLP